ncbi:hypothetical protein PAHAL_1G289000 [Panicum hallii]|uniref:Uncharacterized protein n=1 Tax=Panicum hallii TaxID=206008 RepID=A0A2S3GQF8_9POAL|nr:hypothetical protein PAHAL_1G289000 [Panicum hallii]
MLAARREVSSMAFCSADGEAASGCTEGRRVELLAMELWSTCGWRRLASGDGRRQRNLEDLACGGSKYWIVISLFLGTFVQLGRNSCPLYPLPAYPYVYRFV